MKTLFIITATLNSERDIKNCIESVKKIKYVFKFGKIHHLIADGGSKDKTLSIIRPFIGRDLTLVSIDDSGIYDAWNKCIIYANAVCKETFWINFLGSDDRLLEGFLYYLKFVFLNVDQNINLYTALSFYDGFKNDITIGKSLNKIKLLHSMQISNSTAIYKSTLFKGNLFDTSYKICGDYDFIIRNQKKIKSKHLWCTVTFVKTGGLSVKYKKEVSKEALKSVLNYYKYKPISLILYLLFIFLGSVRNFLKEF